MPKFIAQYYSWIVLTFAAGTVIAIIILLIFYYQSKKAPFFFLREVAEARVRYAFWSAVALLGITLLLLSSPTRSTPSSTSALAQATDTPTLSNPSPTPVSAPQVQTETTPPELTPTWTPTPQPPSTSIFTPSPAPTGGAVQGASFSDLVLAAGITSDSKPLNPTDTFLVGGKPVYLFFHYAGMSEDITWTQSWYRDSTELYKESTRWQWGLAGRAWIFFAPMGGYTPGEYEVRLYIGDVLQQTARFTVR